jgi:hypothetical protein
MTTCAACLFWREVQPGLGMGFCRRRAPERLAAEPGVLSVGVWPVTQATELCGDWTKRPAEPGNKGLTLVKAEETVN